MATIGSLHVNVLARTKQFVSGMNKVSRKMRSVKATANALSGSVLAAGKSFLAAAAAAVTVSAAFNRLKRSFKEVEATARLSDQIGMSTETLVALQFAAESTGSSATDMNSTLLRASRRLGLFQEGAGAAARALTAMGFEADEFKGKSLEESFKIIADDIASLTNVEMQNARAFEILGDSAQALLPILRGGREGIDQLIRSADQMGITFSRHAAEGVLKANQAFTDMNAQLTALTNNLAIDIAPAVTEFAGDLNRIIVAVRDLIKWLDELGASPVFRMIARMNIVSTAGMVLERFGLGGTPDTGVGEVDRQQLSTQSAMLSELGQIRGQMGRGVQLEVVSL